MSRTYRRKNLKHEYEQILTDFCKLKDLVDVSEYERIEYYYDRYCYLHIKKDSARAKKLIRKYHSDAGTNGHKEPGPSWFRNMSVERPNRRSIKNKLRNYLLSNDDYEVIADAKPPLKYWT